MHVHILHVLYINTVCTLRRCSAYMYVCMYVCMCSCQLTYKRICTQLRHQKIWILLHFVLRSERIHCIDYCIAAHHLHHPRYLLPAAVAVRNIPSQLQPKYKQYPSYSMGEGVSPLQTALLTYSMNRESLLFHSVLY